MRDLQRGQGPGLPSGEAMARRMGEAPLTPKEMSLDWTGETPLWFYLLREAYVRQAGERLGPVGGRIVGDVLTSLINRNPMSFRATDPDWTPTLPAQRAGQFGLADLNLFAIASAEAAPDADAVPRLTRSLHPA